MLKVVFYKAGSGLDNGAVHTRDMSAEEITGLLNSGQFVLEPLIEKDQDQQKVIDSVFVHRNNESRLLVTYELLSFPQDI